MEDERGWEKREERGEGKVQSNVGKVREER